MIVLIPTGEPFSRQEALDVMVNPPAAMTMLAGLLPQGEALAALGLGKR